MRVKVFALSSLFVLASLIGVQAAPPSASPIFTNKPRFRIPFRYDPAEMQRLSAREIRLFVSVDRGNRWQHIQSVAPQAGKFEFVAPRNGEYWFSVKTLDTYGQLHPSGAVFEPGLKVVVDTADPQLKLTLSESGGGRIQVAWVAQDETLDLTKLKLEYIEPGGTRWTPMAIVPQPSGKTAWTVSRTGMVAVRGEISDKAGNQAQTQEQLQVKFAPASAPRPSVPDFRQPIANTDQSLQVPDSPPQLSNLNGTSAPIRSLQNALPGDRFQMGTVSDNQLARPEALRGRYPAETEPTYQRGNSRTRIVNKKNFKIGYELEDVGSSGVSSVDLYITQDSGSTWFKYGTDPDRRSPFQVEVPEDGIYGFAIRVQSGVGFVAAPPQPGETPSVTVMVDRTAPKAQLLPVKQGRGAQSNQLQISWKIEDSNPAARPVALYYSASSNGPWEPISGWQEDLGTYTWSVGPGLPAQIYIRLAARDAAGNTSYTATRQPIQIDLSRPSARILDVESIDR